MAKRETIAQRDVLNRRNSDMDQSSAAISSLFEFSSLVCEATCERARNSAIRTIALVDSTFCSRHAVFSAAVWPKEHSRLAFFPS